jgi:hypothetical protein
VEGHVTREELWIALEEEEVTIATGLDDAIIGIGFRCGQPPIAVYDADKCIEVFAEEFVDEGLEPAEAYSAAVEHFEFNTAGAWIGPETPIYVRVVDD